MRRGRHRGLIITTPSGARCFLAIKRIADVFRNGEQSISHAIRSQQAYWSIEEGLLMDMRGRGIQIVGVLVRETSDIYLTHLMNFFGPKVARLSHPWVRGNERYMEFQHFRLKQGAAKF